jgi:hypothetical protein
MEEYATRGLVFSSIPSGTGFRRIRSVLHLILGSLLHLILGSLLPLILGSLLP